MTEERRPVQLLELLLRKEVAPEQDGGQEAGIGFMSLFEALGASLGTKRRGVW